MGEDRAANAAADKIRLSRDQVRDKIYACWLGKNIGGTLGAPYELRKEVLTLTFYDPVPSKAAPNDDLDLQLVWLQMMEDEGVPPKLPSFARYWQRHLSAYPWNEYGFCGRNLRRGLLPPVSGWFENYYVDEMGSPIRSEIWACLCPGDPQRAAALAWMDSAVDHAGGEGTYGEMFWSAVESAAFAITDPRQLIRIGLAMIPPACRISRVIREVLWCHSAGLDPLETRRRILASFGHENPCDAIQNHGFTILGWLWGDGFGDSLLRAVNCGYDTDCTGATLGAVLGIIGGAAGIPEEWSAPVGDSIVLHAFTGKIDSPVTVGALTDRVLALADRMMETSDSVAWSETLSLTPDALGRLSRADLAVAALAQDLRAAVASAGPGDITFHYGGDPVFEEGVARQVRISWRDLGSGHEAELLLPEGWRAERLAQSGDAVYQIVPGAVEASNTVGVRVGPHEADFTILGPRAAAGFPASVNIECCSVCHAAKGSCLCPPVR